MVELFFRNNIGKGIYFFRNNIKKGIFYLEIIQNDRIYIEPQKMIVVHCTKWSCPLKQHFYTHCYYFQSPFFFLTTAIFVSAPETTIPIRFIGSAKDIATVGGGGVGGIICSMCFRGEVVLSFYRRMGVVCLDWLKRES